VRIASEVHGGTGVRLSQVWRMKLDCNWISTDKTVLGGQKIAGRTRSSRDPHAQPWPRRSRVVSVAETYRQTYHMSRSGGWSEVGQSVSSTEKVLSPIFTPSSLNTTLWNSSEAGRQVGRYRLVTSGDEVLRWPWIRSHAPGIAAENCSTGREWSTTSWRASGGRTSNERVRA